jgi:hypothetical protein
VRSRLTLENDGHAYGAAEVLAVCRAAGVPMVFDPSIGEMLAAAGATPPRTSRTILPPE